MLLCLISTFKKKRTGWACLYQLPVQSPKGQRVSYIHGYAAYQFFYKKIGRTSIIISKCVEGKAKRHLIRRRITCICQKGYTHIYVPF